MEPQKERNYLPKKNKETKGSLIEREKGLPARLVMALDRARAEDTPLPVPDMSSPSSSLENFSLTISASATHQPTQIKIGICNSRTSLHVDGVQEKLSPEGGPSCRAGLGGTAVDEEVPAAALSDGPPASGGGRSTERRLPLDPQLLDRIRLVEGATGGVPSMVRVSVPSSDSGDDDDADLRRLNENLSRPWPIFWNGRAITSAWLARARALQRPRCQRGAFLGREKERGARFWGRRGEGGICWQAGNSVRGWVAGGAELVGFSLVFVCPLPSAWKTATLPACGARLFYRARSPESGWPAKYKNMHA